MATKIKLQVNHSKHAKQQSGQKISIPAEKVTQAEKNKSEVKQNKLKEKDTGLADNKQKNIQKSKQSPKKQQPKEKSPKKQQKSPQKPNPKQKQNPNQKNQSSSPKKKDTELQTLQRIKNTQQKTKVTIEDLIHQYKNAADDIFTNHGHNEEKERIIERKLEKLRQEKQARHKKIQKLEEISMNRSLKKQKSVSEKQQKNEQKARQKRRKRAQRKLAALHALSQQRLKNEQAFQDYYNNQYKSKQFRYKKYEQEYKEKQQAYQAQIKQKLEKHKKKYEPMNGDELADFMDQYEHNRWNMIEENQKKREFQREVLENQNRELMAKMWRGQCHRRVKQQRQELKAIKNQGKTKLEKTKQYGTMVKAQFKPKINEEKRNRSLSISQTVNIYNDHPSQIIDGKQYRKVAREKYANGVNQGLVIENLRKSLDHEQKVKKGNQYLQFLRSLPKAPKPNPETTSQQPPQNPQQSRKKTPSTTFKPHIPKNPYYSNPSERISSKSATVDQKRIKDPQLFHYMMADMKSKIGDLELEEKAIKYGKYNGILELQDRHSSLNRKLVQGISQKLSILGKM